MAIIHATSIIDPKAQLAESCRIGPFCNISGPVVIGEGTEIGQGCVFTGNVTVGAANAFSPYCCIGTPPQDVSYHGEQFAVQIGNNNVFREFVTVNMGTAKERGLTVIGNDNYFMANTHVAHDCEVGNEVVFVNYVGISGHSKVGDHVIISGLTGVHHFVTIGEYAFIGGMSRIIHDAPPYMMTEGNPSKVHRVNIVGLQRHGFSPESIEALKEAHRILYRSKLTRVDAFRILESREGGSAPEVRRLIEFLTRQMEGRQGRQREILRAGSRH